MSLCHASVGISCRRRPLPWPSAIFTYHLTGKTPQPLALMCDVSDKRIVGASGTECSLCVVGRCLDLFLYQHQQSPHILPQLIHDEGSERKFDYFAVCFAAGPILYLILFINRTNNFERGVFYLVCQPS